MKPNTLYKKTLKPFPNSRKVNFYYSFSLEFVLKLIIKLNQHMSYFKPIKNKLFLSVKCWLIKGDVESKMKIQLYKAYCCLLLIIFSFLPLEAKVKYSFKEEYSLEEQKKILNTVSSMTKEDIAQLLSQYPMTKQFDFLAYIGMNPYDSTDRSESNLLKSLVNMILQNDKVLQADIYYDSMDNDIKKVSPLVKHIVMSPKYEDYLFDLYLNITNKSAPSFWTSYDLFNNIIAWNKKNHKLFETKVITLKDGKTAVSQVPSASLQLFANYLSEDINEVLKKINVENSPKLTFVDMKKNRASAWYSARRHTVYINLGSSNISWSALMGEVLWHELFHVWQHSYVNKTISEDFEKNAAMFNQGDLTSKESIWLAGILNANLKSYQPSSKGYEYYKSQPVEAEAFEFGKRIFKSLLR